MKYFSSITVFLVMFSIISLSFESTGSWRVLSKLFQFSYNFEMLENEQNFLKEDFEKEESQEKESSAQEKIYEFNSETDYLSLANRADLLSHFKFNYLNRNYMPFTKEVIAPPPKA